MKRTIFLLIILLNIFNIKFKIPLFKALIKSFCRLTNSDNGDILNTEKNKKDRMYEKLFKERFTYNNPHPVSDFMRCNSLAPGNLQSRGQRNRI